MTNEIQIVNITEFINGLRHLEKEITQDTALKAVTAAGHVIEAQAKINVENNKLRLRGHLINSIKVYDRTVEKNKVWIHVGSRGVIYARIHEYGGTIKAKRAKFLTIPQTKMAQEAGSPRNFPGELEFRGGRGGGVLVEKKSKKLQYVLVRSVKIPMRAYLRPAIDETKSSQISAFTAQIRKGLSGYM